MVVVQAIIVIVYSYRLVKRHQREDAEELAHKKLGLQRMGIRERGYPPRRG
jgi:hypothetical protein